jgi:hypothetical protein
MVGLKRPNIKKVKQRISQLMETSKVGSGTDGMMRDGEVVGDRVEITEGSAELPTQVPGGYTWRVALKMRSLTDTAWLDGLALARLTLASGRLESLVAGVLSPTSKETGRPETGTMG